MTTFLKWWDGLFGTSLMWAIALTGFALIGSGWRNALNPTAPDAASYVLDFSVRLIFGIIMASFGGWYVYGRIGAGARQRQQGNRITRAWAGFLAWWRDNEEAI
jgi:hypothetical protein